jgi:prepilin-type N-terminal cleavage/methylation domain-containing protein
MRKRRISRSSATSSSRARERSGFSLIELLVVISIISLLTAILVPSLYQAKSLAQQTLCAGNLRNLYTCMTLYQQDNTEYYPCNEQDPIPGETYWLWMGRGWRWYIEPYLGGKHDAQRGRSMLYCKADTGLDKYEATSYAYSMAFYHTPEQINSLTSTADTYSNPLPSVGRRPLDMRYPQRKILLGEWTSNHAYAPNDKGWWCWEGTRNFLMADGAVMFLDATRIQPANDGFPDPNLTKDGLKGTDF